MDLIVSAGIVEQKGRKQFTGIKREVRATQGDGHALTETPCGFQGILYFLCPVIGLTKASLKAFL